MVAAPRWLQPDAACAALTRGALPRTVVVAGGDIGGRGRVVEAVRAAAKLDRAAGGLTLLSGDEIELGAVRAALGSLGLLVAGPRVIHVRRSEALFQRGGGARPKAKAASKSAKSKAAVADPEPGIPSGDADALLLWETELAPDVHEPKWAAEAIAQLAGADPNALLVDCSFPGGEKGRARLEQAAALHGARLSKGALRSLAAIAENDPADLERTLTAVSLLVGQAEIQEDDVETVRRAARTDSGDLMRELSSAVQNGDAARALRLWAEAGEDRGDPIPLLAWLVGGLLAGLEKGYSRAARDPSAARAFLGDARRLDEMLKSSVGDRDTLGALILAHLSGLGPHLTDDATAPR